MFHRYFGHRRYDVNRIFQLRHSPVHLLRAVCVRLLGDQQVFRHAFFSSAVRQRHTVFVLIPFYMYPL